MDLYGTPLVTVNYIIQASDPEHQNATGFTAFTFKKYLLTWKPVAISSVTV